MEIGDTMAGDANADVLDTPKTIFLKRNDEPKKCLCNLVKFLYVIIPL